MDENLNQENNFIQDTPQQPRSLKIIIAIIVTALVCLVVGGMVVFFLLRSGSNEPQEVSGVPEQTQVAQGGLLYPTELYTSPDGTFSVYSGYTNSNQQIVVVNNRQSEPYDSISNVYVNEATGAVYFTGEQNGNTYLVKDFEKVGPYDDFYTYQDYNSYDSASELVSENDKWVIHLARRGTTNYLLVNGEEKLSAGALAIGFEGDVLMGYTNITPTLSEATEKVAFQIQENDQEAVLVYDLNTETSDTGTFYESILGDPVYSSTGRLAYKVKENGQVFLVVDGKEQTKFNAGGTVAWDPVFSPDGNHVAYALPDESDRMNRTYSVVLDGERLQIHEGFGGSVYPEFSTDSTQLIYETNGETFTYDIASGTYVD